MESIVFFGKGGIGKSTIASNMTALLAAGGRKVLHVGCDPKMDSTLALMRRHILPFAVKSIGPSGASLADSVYPSPYPNIFCLEAGGPQAGVGCAGTGIGSMLDAMKDSALLEKGGYDSVVFDVLGDVVCGGFAAPLRRGFARKVVIVTSEEMLSLYAANRLVMMVNNYSRNGVYLAGLAANVKSPEGAAVVKEFAAAVGAKVLGVVLRDRAVAEAEREHEPASLAHPKSDFARRARALCAAIRSAGPGSHPVPMPDEDFFAFAEGKAAPAAARPGPVSAGAAARRKAGAVAGAAADLFREAGLSPTGMEGSQIICDWEHPDGKCRVVLAPAGAADDGRPRFSDWTVCFHPSTPNDAMQRASGDLMKTAERLSVLRFDQMLSCFTGIKDFYGGLLDPGKSDDRSLKAADTPRTPHTGFGQWHRFIFPGGLLEAAVPPGAVLVEHADSECRFSGCEGSALGLFSENAGPKAGGDSRGPQLPRRDGRIVNNDFSARDSVFGDEPKMLSSLRAAAEQAGPAGLVEFYVGCSPMMLASDTAAMVARVEREKGVKVVVERFNSFYEHAGPKAAVRASFMAARLSAARKARRGPPSAEINLVNWSSSPSAGLPAMLAARGLSCVRPSPDFYADAAAAKLQVISGPDTVLGPAFDRAGFRWIAPGAPYGFSGTSAWFAAIEKALGKRPGPGPSAPQLGEARALWKALKRYAAAFVLAPEEMEMLCGSPAMRMVPVLPALAEAGMRVSLLLAEEERGGDGRPPVRERAKAAAAALKRSLPGLKFSLSFFRTPGELRALLLREKSLRLVYSDVRRDPRVVSAGLNPFSAALFEPGYAGAVETWRRLLELCEWDFNEKYLA